MDLFDDMKKVKVGSLDDMEVERVRSSGKACFGCGRCESGVKWWGTIETTPIELVRGYLTPHLQNPPPIDVHLCHLALLRNPTPFYQETPLPPPLSLMFVDQHFQESLSLLWRSLSCSFKTRLLVSGLSSCSLKILLVVAKFCHPALSRPPSLQVLFISKPYHKTPPNLITNHSL